MPKETIRMFMHCRTCGNGSHAVGVNTSNELVIWCKKCNKPVAVISHWPDPRLTGVECDCCKNKKTIN